MDYEAKIKELQQQREQILIACNYQLGVIEGQLTLLADLVATAKKSETIPQIPA